MKEGKWIGVVWTIEFHCCGLNWRRGGSCTISRPTHNLMRVEAMVAGNPVIGILVSFFSNNFCFSNDNG